MFELSVLESWVYTAIQWIHWETATLHYIGQTLQSIGINFQYFSKSITFCILRARQLYDVIMSVIIVGECTHTCFNENTLQCISTYLYLDYIIIYSYAVSEYEYY